MPRRAVKIEFEDSDGERYTIKLEGRLSKDKVMRIMDMYELLAQNSQQTAEINADTIFGRIQQIITNRFPLRRFTSTELQEAYEDEHREPIKIATISTYLARLLEQGTLHRSRIGRKWIYSLITPIQARPSLRMPDIRNCEDLR